ncbi:MAG: sortase [Oscillospiraceae bacterium]|nr:sortase [Oscillospiraceae bacterium]
MRGFAGKLMISVGLAALAAAAGLTAYNRWDDRRAGDISALIAHSVFTQIGHAEDLGSAAAEPPNGGADGQTPEEPAGYSPPPFVELDGERYIGLLTVPSLSLRLPVNSELDDARLRNSPCRYIGEPDGHLVISAHNYDRHFGGISALSYGDVILLLDANGNEHQYRVELIEILHETAVEEMINSPYDLTLFTCTRSRTERVTVRGRKARLNDEAIFGDAPDAPRAPNYKIDYATETVKLRRGYLYSTDGGDVFTEVTTSGGMTLDVSENITSGSPVYIRRAATSSRPASRVQTVRPAPRAVLSGQELEPPVGRLRLDSAYEVYDPSSGRWGRLPAITGSGEFAVRVKSTARVGSNGTTGRAASLPGTLTVIYGVTDSARGRTGVVSAQITGAVTHEPVPR